MRVITGSARGRKLKTPDGCDTRPTTDMVKEAVFSIIQFMLPYASVLDLFAGSGQIGIEALSRGAKKATFVDSGKAPREVIRENLLLTGFTKQSRVINQDVVDFIQTAVEVYDIIFLDPPYHMGYPEKILPCLERILSDDGIVLVEHANDETLPEEIPGLVQKKRYRYGKTAVTTYIKGKA